MTKYTIFSTDQDMDRFMNEIRPVVNDFASGKEQDNEITYAVMELLANAQDHGNANEADRKIVIEVETKQGFMVFGIEDEGVGTKRPEIPKEYPPLSSPRGRGLKSIIDMGFTVHFNDTGNKVTLVIKKED
ncbi:MAG: ATP-binding protein [Candidatus Magnetobacterium sp. LHC-1]|uniref:ATP-binding protein n=1 Tax=Candidatus Magnetobacterium casense TaxID=1455061 RepID=A0ABS6S221_9BACT|nr:ATP-binding protein [Candidatus Magnetobacterium casensis]MBF0606254.1 ATP-binding protein [Nitrospirota bacterium]MBV6342655.1 ATP-binding protein [Candidatus Magnetobacterium casensis]